MKHLMMIFAVALAGVVVAAPAKSAEKAKAEIAKVNAEIDALAKEVTASLKTNGLENAAAAADKLIPLLSTVASDGKTKPRLSPETAFGRTILPGFAGKKVMGAAYTLKYYDRYFELMKKMGRTVPYDQAVARIDFLWTYDYAPLAELRPQADAALAEANKHMDEAHPRDREALPFKLLARRAGLFDGADREQFRARAEQLAGGDVAKRLLYYAEFPDGGRILKDAALTDVHRAAKLYKHLEKTPFADKEALLERALKTPGLDPADKAVILENYVALERAGLPRNWIGEEPKRFNGVFTVANADPVAYGKAKAAQKELIALTPADEKKTLADRSLALLDLSYTALRTADVREAFAALEKALPDAKDLWEMKATAYLAASAYYDEDYEKAYELFHRFPVEAYKGKDRVSTSWWYKVAEPYIRTCVAMRQYDEAYLLSTEITAGMIEGWESWHRAQYKAKFAELAKLCKPETVEAVKAAAAKTGKKK